MKIRIILLTSAGLLLLLLSFIIGGLYGAHQASYSGHTGTLIWLTGIDKALQAGDLQAARHLNAKTVDAHVGVLRQLDRSPSAGLLYALPWSRSFVGSTNDALLDRTQKYFEDHQDQLQPETRTFLARFTNR